MPEVTCQIVHVDLFDTVVQNLSYPARERGARCPWSGYSRRHHAESQSSQSGGGTEPRQPVARRDQTLCDQWCGEENSASSDDYTAGIHTRAVVGTTGARLMWASCALWKKTMF